MEEEESNEALEQVQKEIQETIKQAGKDDFEIEIVEDDPEPEQKAEPETEPEEKAAEDESEPEYGAKVQRRIKKLVDQRREAELQAREFQEQTAQLQSRLERLEKGTENSARHQAESDFQSRYQETRSALAKAVEEGDTENQLQFTEQLADMRAAIRIAELQKSQAAQQASSPTVGRAQQAAQAPAPEKAMDWWQKNRWFNSAGFERETAAARAIDVQLDIEGFDKDSENYYDALNNRLRNVFPELNSEREPVKAKPKSRSPVAPTAGGSSYKGNRIRLSNDQLRMARELGITDEAGLKKYEAEVRRQTRS